MWDRLFTSANNNIRSRTRIYIFFLNREETRKWLVTHAVGTNMPNLNTDILSDVPIAYPLLEEQRRIVQVLNSLDEKIALNSAVNDNLPHQSLMVA